MGLSAKQSLIYLTQGFESLLFYMITFHIKELKYRLFYFSISWFFSIISIWQFKQDIILYLININLIFTNLTEAFYLYIYFTILIAFIFNLPILYFNIYYFILPGLYQYQVNKLIHLVLLFWIYFIYNANYIIQILIQFFLIFESQYISLLWTFNHFIKFINYFNFIIIFCLFFIIFLYFYNHYIYNNRRLFYFTLAIFIAIITPPDIISLLFIFIPLFIISEILLYYNFININK